MLRAVVITGALLLAAAAGMTVPAGAWVLALGPLPASALALSFLAAAALLPLPVSLGR